MLKRALATEELQEWLSLSVMHDCLIGSNGLYNPLLLGHHKRHQRFGCKCDGFCTRYDMWFNPLLDSGNGFEAVISESAFTAAGVDCSEFPNISKIEHPLISFADVERSQY